MKLKSQQDGQNFTKTSPLIDKEMAKKFPLNQDATNQTLKCSCQVLQKTKKHPQIQFILLEKGSF